MSQESLSENKNTAGDYAYLQKGKTLLAIRAGDETSKKTRSIAESFMRDASFQNMPFSELEKLSRITGEQRYADSKVKEIFSHSQ